VRSFREVLDGNHDDLPESAFFLKGSIDQVVEAAKGSSRKDEKDEKKDDEKSEEDDS
jgi:hypothetical protein